MEKIYRIHWLLILYIVFKLFFATNLYGQEIGLASFYHDKFEGRKTSNGELYDHDKLTAAHRSIPFGTVLRVTNMKTQNSVIVRVNDRGPFNKRFIIDLSKEAAKAIDVHDGSQEVKIEILENTVIGEVSIHDIGKKKDTIIANPIVESKEGNVINIVEEKNILAPPKEIELVKNIYKVESTELPKNQYAIKVERFESFEKLMDFKQKHRLNKLENTLIYLDKEKKDVDYILLIGPFLEKTEAKAFQKTLKKNINGSIILLDSLEK